MNVNQKGVDLVKRFEGLRLAAYVDPVGILTIGYGHTGKDVKPGQVISPQKAEDLLKADLEHAAKGVRKKLQVTAESSDHSPWCRMPITPQKTSCGSLPGSSKCREAISQCTLISIGQ